jgi:dipeptidyl aminopeptidase/acylaminoacyl peptidase
MGARQWHSTSQMNFTRIALMTSFIFTAAGAVSSPEYRVPANPEVARLLTASQTPGAEFNAQAGRIAFIHRESLVPVERITRPHLGLAGFSIDPEIRASGYDSRVKRVEVLDARSGVTLATWEPDGEPALDNIDISPEGRYLSAVSFRNKQPRLVLFEIATGREQLLPVAVNPAFGAPCEWMGEKDLLCRIIPDETAVAPALYASPNIMDHPGGRAATRTYSNLLDNAWEEELFEYYFSSTLARVGIDGKVRRLEGTTGLLARVQLSPDQKHALVVRLQRPYSHLLRATHFPRQFELWNLESGEKIDAPSLLQQGGITPTKGIGLPTFSWQSDTGALGWTESRKGGGDRWLALDPPYTGKPREVVSSEGRISGFGWTDHGTPHFSQSKNRGTEVSVFIVAADQTPRLVWKGAVKDVYGEPGSAIRTNGDSGPVLEYKRHIFLSSDGLGPEGPQPYIDALNLDTLEVKRLATADEGNYERVVGIVDPETRTFLTVRESETEPPQLFSVTEGKHTPLGGLYNPFPELYGVERRNVTYTRKDGVQLNGMLYLPRNRDPSKPLPTLVWIYPAEFSDEQYAEQMDSRRFRFHQIKEASPIAAVLDGYALLLNPTVPIIGEGEDANDNYQAQLVSSMEAAIDYLVDNGISDRNRMAVAGRSYGAFSTANLLAHSDLFRTGIAISGAYNRTLTPFGFQHEKRSLWDAASFYTRMSPFYFADQINEPFLIMHGGADDNPGTPTLQARRMFHALVGNGARVRYVELPYEQHHYRARENVLHTSAEMLDWLDQTIGPKSGASASPKN